MSNVMLFGVLRMPYEIAMSDDLSRIQFHMCAKEAANRIEALEAEIERLRTDAKRYQVLRDLMHSAKGSASIEVNQHLAYYEPAKPGEEVKLQWYPDTPIGFYTIEGSTLDDVADEAIEFVAANP